jgi:hypothetical protein
LLRRRTRSRVRFRPVRSLPKRSLTLLYAVTSPFDALPNELVIRILSVVLPTRAKGSLAVLLLCKRFYELGRPDWLSTWVFRTDDPHSREKLATLASRRSLHAFVVDLMALRPSFRLVMALDRRNGELSRAMRNRGIEIAVLPSAVSPSTADSFSSDEFREPSLTPLTRLAASAQSSEPAV